VRLLEVDGVDRAGMAGGAGGAGGADGDALSILDAFEILASSTDFF
jgi:hypothetical protein